MSPATFTRGDTVHDIRGNVYLYIGQCDRGHAVQAIYQGDEGEPYYDEPIALSEVFAEPPRQRLAEDLSELQAEIDAKQQELTDLRAAAYAAENERRAIFARAKKDPQLADLYLWMEGKATHLVVLDHYSVCYGLVDDMLRSTDRDRRLRLLSLYVDPKEQRYYVARAAYSDGSGSNTSCRLASSEEHAKEIAREYIAQKMRESGTHLDATWTRLAIEFGVPVAPERVAKLRADTVKNLTENVIRARSSHEHSARSLAEAEALLAKEAS